MSPEPFDLNLRHLRALPAIMRHGSINAAAEEVSLSQPALTQGLAKLERQLGTTLFVRRFDGMAATDAGRTVARRVRSALAHLRTASRPMTGDGARGFARPDHLMTATQLRAFLGLANVGSFLGAAQATGISQPAIHRAVRDLEQLSATPLLERRGRGVALTAAGRRLARGARLAETEIAAAIAEAAPTGTMTGRLAVGAMPLCRARLLPMAIARFAEEAPDVRVEVLEGSWRELIEPLRDGRIDLTIGALRDPTPADLDQLPLFDDHLVVIARAGHPLSREPAPDARGLASFPWIVARSGTPLRRHWHRLFDGGTLPRAPIECGSVMTIRGILCESDFLTLLSPDQVALEVEGGVLAAIGGPVPASRRTIGVTTRRDSRPTLLQARFVQLLRDVAESLQDSGNPIAGQPI
ncbi:LysR family transcriptional regulator [Sphingosinicella ginsenosidimutans]|jgi:DNA-binding transcriptional LysR family regulator|uniref:LysR family transcriptional regulator n=1 Tax=Allosphingosinicella ginsenosidimutans TaxID=1176539 RepID=A0A5C6TPT4_9SPHN|nr:LysR substrate-binding domain-containing protein [Sphingosinicella ginsenosidimutans]TXC62414.1 LysR family transcriptional regulator [Sphingosinicella ginsenosidimutans]